MTKPRDSRHHAFLLSAALIFSIGLLVTSCNSSSPTEPDDVASVPAAGPSNSNGSSSASDSGQSSGGSDSGSGTTDTADSSGDPGSSSSEGQPGSLTVKLVDAPTDEICQLWVYFSELRIKPDGGPPEFVLPGFFPQAYDLLTLRNGNEEEMGEFAIEQRKYQFLEILLDQSQSYVVEKDPDNDCDSGTVGDTVALQIPSGKFKVKGNPFTVDASTTITIDFDADQSLKRKGSSKNPKGWQLTPSVSVVNVSP